MQFVDVSLVFSSRRLVFHPIEKQNVIPVKIIPVPIDNPSIGRRRLDDLKVVGYCVEHSNLFVLRICDLFNDVVVWGFAPSFVPNPDLFFSGYFVAFFDSPSAFKNSRVFPFSAVVAGAAAGLATP